MQILSDSELKRMIKEGLLGIDPMPSDAAFQPASIDLRLGKVYRQKKMEGPIDIVFDMDFNEDDFLEEVEFDSDIEIDAGKFIVLETEERVKIPGGHFARVFQRSRYGRMLAESFAPAFRGHDSPLLIGGINERIRYSFKPFVKTVLHKGERICQMAVFDMKGNIVSTEEGVGLEISEDAKVCSGCENIVLYAANVYTPKHGIILDPSKPISLEEDFEKYEKRFLSPGKIYLVKTRERIKLSNRTACIVEPTLCSDLWGAQNYLHACFAGFVDPGYEGDIMLQVYSNIGPIDRERPLTIMTVYPIKGKVERPYGSSKLGSSHQGKF